MDMHRQVFLLLPIISCTRLHQDLQVSTKSDANFSSSFQFDIPPAFPTRYHIHLDTMGSIGCCTSRHPPSPDGVAPRPVGASPASVHLHAKSEDLLTASWASDSALSRPEDAEAIQAIFAEDKSSHGDDHENILFKKASITLNAVKSRLKKHLSKDSGFTSAKRLSHTSVGTSEEEVERRAELRRIRHIRIKEDLSQEGVYDDDAKSLSTIDSPDAPSTSVPQRRASWAPTDPLHLLDLDMASLPIPKSSRSRADGPSRPLFHQYASFISLLFFFLHY